MDGVLIEATQDLKTGFNWGKFYVARFTPDEWRRQAIVGDPDAPRRRHGTPAEVTAGSLLRLCGWDTGFIWVLDCQTGEGALFRPPGSARADLGKHRIWVCPMFEPFLEWLYLQDLTDLSKLPGVVELPHAEAEMYGYRRSGMG